MTETTSYVADAVRADGGLVRIRSVTPADRAALHELNRRMSDRSIYMRFFTINRDLADRYADRLIDHASDRTLVATVHGELVGVASFEPLEPGQAEIALIVAEPHQHHGIGTLLLEHLAAAARRRGFTEFVAEILSENVKVGHVLAELGTQNVQVFQGPESHVVIDLNQTDELVEAIGARELIATVRSLAPLLTPTTIAVIGATDRPRSAGRAVLEQLIRRGFAGAIYPIDPAREQVLGLRCHASLADLPEVPDLAVVAVPAAAVLDVVRQCGERGARGVVVLPGGGDCGGRSDGAELRAIARSFGMRLIGPDSVGIVNTAVGLAVSAAPIPVVVGTLGLASQSGGLGVAVAGTATRAGLGISQFVSLGERADVSTNDLLLWWENDPATKAIALYVESFGNPRRFARIARRVARTKPILAIRSGPREDHAFLSRTAGEAASPSVVDALFDRAGVVCVDTVSELVDAARVLVGQPLPRGPRTAIIGNTGGPALMALDAARRDGLVVPTLSPELTSRLAGLLPGAISLANPVDLGSDATSADFSAAVGEVVASGEVDALVIVASATAAVSGDEVRSAATAELPVVLNLIGPDELGWGGPAPVFEFPESAAAALAVAWRYARLRARPETTSQGLDWVVPDPAQALVTSADGWLDEAGVAALLRSCDIVLRPGASGSVGLVVGGLQDPLFGPAVMVAVGGAAAEFLTARSFGLAPLMNGDAEELISGLPAAALHGVPRAAVRDLVRRVAVLLVRHPEVLELDLGPVVCDGEDAYVTGARIRIGPTQDYPDPLLRQLTP